jgi:hypothetical protein
MVKAFHNKEKRKWKRSDPRNPKIKNKKYLKKREHIEKSDKGFSSSY